MTQSMVGMVRNATQSLWGVPDCDNCTKREECFIRTLDCVVEGCSDYQLIVFPTQGKGDDNA